MHIQVALEARSKLVDDNQYTLTCGPLDTRFIFTTVMLASNRVPVTRGHDDLYVCIRDVISSNFLTDTDLDQV